MTNGFWNGKRVLITGNTGFKGSWLSYWLSRLGADVTGLSLAPHTTPNLYESACLSECFETRVVDVRHTEAVAEVARACRCEIVFHLAAQSLVRPSYDRPIDTYAVNTMGTANVLEAARVTGTVRAVLCVTTDKCYDNREWIWPYRETDALGGHDPYSSSKACAELVASAYTRSYFSADDAPAVATARAGNVIGGGDWSRDRLVPDLARAFHSGAPAIVRNPEAVRPWQSVLDALRGYMILAERMYEEPRAFSEAWNFGPDASSERSVRFIADRFREAWDSGAGWRHAPSSDAPHEAGTLKLDSSKARARLGWRNIEDVAEIVPRIARWYLEYYRGADARALIDRDLNDFEKRVGRAS